MVLVDGRPEIVDDVAALPTHARTWLRDELDRIAMLPDYEYGVEGALAGRGSGDRAAVVTIPRLRQLAKALT